KSIITAGPRDRRVRRSCSGFKKHELRSCSWSSAAVISNWAVATTRPAVSAACAADLSQVETALHAEEQAFRAADRAYWQPLRAELFQWRRALRRSRNAD